MRRHRPDSIEPLPYNCLSNTDFAGEVGLSANGGYCAIDWCLGFVHKRTIASLSSFINSIAYRRY